MALHLSPSCFSKWDVLCPHPFLRYYLSSIFPKHSKLNFTLFFFLLIKFFDHKNCPISLSNSRRFFKGVRFFSLNLVTHSSIFWLSCHFSPVTPAANTRICFDLHTVCARYTMSTKLMCGDDNKWRNKESFNTGKGTNSLLCTYDLFSSKEERAMTSKLSPTGNSPPNSLHFYPNIVFPIGYYVNGRVALDNLRNVKTKTKPKILQC